MQWRSDLLDFDQFQKSYLNHALAGQALFIADEELLDYYDYRVDRLIEPRVDYVLPDEHLKLERWFMDHFRREFRSYNPDSVMVPAGFDDDFIRFKANLHELYLNKELGFIKSKDLLVKKILQDIWQKTPDAAYYYPEIVDKIDFVQTGSNFYFYELYWNLASGGDTAAWDQFRHFVLNYQDHSRFNKLKKPMLLIKPWKHQEEAVETWIRQGRGVIEMATATGKTLVGLYAAYKLYQRLGKLNVLVLTHSKAILNQWRKEAIKKLGFPANSSLDYRHPVQCDGLKFSFETLQTAYKNTGSYRDVDFLIIDEVHHTAAYSFNGALNIKAHYRMGLSATVEGREKLSHIVPKIGPMLKPYTLADARRDNIIPDFEWGIHMTYLDVKEQEEFSELSEKIRKLFNYIVADSERKTRELFGKTYRIKTIKDLVDLMEKARYEGKYRSVPEDWRNFSNMVLRRRMIIHRSMPKIERAAKIAEESSKGQKVVVFSMLKETCDTISQRLTSAGVKNYVINSDNADKDNFAILEKFKREKNCVLIAAKMLDEGIDIPDAEVGINVSFARTRLQMVQRLGRILRKDKNNPNKKPVFHQLVALPHERDFIEKEDGIYAVDEVSWIVDMAQQWDVGVEIYDDSFELESLRKQSENAIKPVLDVDCSLPEISSGSLRLDKLIIQFEPSIRTELIKSFQVENREVSYNYFNTLIRNVYQRKEGSTSTNQNLKGLYYLYVYIDKKPINAIPLLRKYY